MSTGLIRSTAIVGGVTLISRVLGLVRDIIIARAFGAGTGADAFFVAFKIPNFLRRLFAEGSFSQAFVPILSEYRARRSHQEIQSLVDAVAGVSGGVLLVVTVLGILAAPLLVLIFAPGFLAHAAKFDLTVQLVRLTFPYILFISLTALAGSILNSYGRFGIPAFTPVFLNLSLIGAALWLAPQLQEPVTGLAWGVFIAGAVQLGFQLPFLKRIGLVPHPRWRRGADSGVGRVVRLMLPGIFGSSVAQINLLIDTLIASFLVTGSVSWLYYADRLMEFPLGVFGIALATVILPRLSQHHATLSHEQYSHTLDWALRMVAIIGTPAAIGLYILAGPLLVSLFQYGEFSAQDVHMAELSLRAYAFGLLGFMLVKVLVPAFYSRQDVKTPVKIGIVAMLANIILNMLIVIPMMMWDIPGPHAGLALATTLAAFLNAGLLFRQLWRERRYRPTPGWMRLFMQLLAANTALALVLVFAVGDLERWAAGNWEGRVVDLAWCTVAGAVVYFTVLRISGLRWRQWLQSPGVPP